MPLNEAYWAAFGRWHSPEIKRVLDSIPEPIVPDTAVLREVAKGKPLDEFLLGVFGTLDPIPYLKQQSEVSRERLAASLKVRVKYMPRLTDWFQTILLNGKLRAFTNELSGQSKIGQEYWSIEQSRRAIELGKAGEKSLYLERDTFEEFLNRGCPYLQSEGSASTILSNDQIRAQLLDEVKAYKSAGRKMTFEQIKVFVSARDPTMTRLAIRKLRAECVPPEWQRPGAPRKRNRAQ